MMHRVFLVVIALLAVPAAADQSSPPPRGWASLEVTISKSGAAGDSSSVLMFLVPLDEDEHEFRSGSQLPIQTKVNSVVTTIFIDVTTRASVALIPYSSANEHQQYVVMTGGVQESNVIRQLGIPFSIAEGPLLASAYCRGDWILKSGVPRQLCSSSRKGLSASSWTVSASLTWRKDGWKGKSLDLGQTSTTLAATRISAGPGEVMLSISCDRVTSIEFGCESFFGKQVPLVTNAAGTKTTNFIDVGARISLGPGKEGATTVTMEDNSLTPAPDIQRIDFSTLGTTRGVYAVDPTVTEITGLPVSRLAKTGEAEVSIILQEYSKLTPSIGTK